MNFTPFPALSTERLYLRQITPDDSKEFFILKSDERLLNTYDAKAKTFEEAQLFLQRLNEEVSRNEWIIWGLALRSDNKLIGSVCFWNISELEPKAEIGYELMQEFQGKGIMQEAVKAVIEYGFTNMKLKLIEALPNPNHLKSTKLLEKNNFVKGANYAEKDPSDGRILQRVFYSLKSEI